MEDRARAQERDAGDRSAEAHRPEGPQRARRRGGAPARVRRSRGELARRALRMTAPKRRTPAGDAASQLAVQVLRLSGLLIDEGDALTAPMGQSSARWRVLATI